MTRWRAAWRVAVRATATGLAWLLLAPIFWVLFIPARLVMVLRGRDPLRVEFPAPGDSRWEPPAP